MGKGLRAVALLAAGCVGDVGPAIGYSRLEACFRREAAEERVFRTAGEWQAFVASAPGSTVPEDVDFARRMIVARFDGLGSACSGFSVESVTERDGAIVVRATRHVSPNPCVAVIAYPQLVLAVERRDGPVSFRIADARDDPPGPPPCT